MSQTHEMPAVRASQCWEIFGVLVPEKKLFYLFLLDLIIWYICKSTSAC